MIEKQLIEDGRRVRHWSDAGMMIRQIETGNEYEDAVDIAPCRYTYEETDTPIPSYDDEPTPEDYEAALNRLGVAT